ncbi:MAG: hypothetical protein K5799_08925 [Erythrobacter sp.]|nr:hypothetical protein [Erythrobacter sp.]
MRLLRLMPAFGLAIFTGACAVVPDAPLVAGNPLPPGTPVGIDQPVRVGELVVTPKKVVEDSRCPENVRCVWAGRLIVRTRIDGAGWRDTADITLGETYGTHGRVIALVSGLPEKSAEAETPAERYRFVYEAR